MQLRSFDFQLREVAIWVVTEPRDTYILPIRSQTTSTFSLNIINGESTYQKLDNWKVQYLIEKLRYRLLSVITMHFTPILHDRHRRHRE